MNGKSYVTTCVYRGNIATPGNATTLEHYDANRLLQKKNVDNGKQICSRKTVVKKYVPKLSLRQLLGVSAQKRGKKKKKKDTDAYVTYRFTFTHSQIIEMRETN